MDTPVYLTNNQRLDLGLVGQSDRNAADIQAAIAKAPAGYYVQDAAAGAAAKAAVAPGGGGAGGGIKRAKR